jgi:hypothetical protein
MSAEGTSESSCGRCLLVFMFYRLSSIPGEDGLLRLLRQWSSQRNQNSRSVVSSLWVKGRGDTMEGWL